MKKIIFLAVILIFSLSVFPQENILKDGSFENLNANDQLPRIAAFSDYGKLTQTQNPSVEATTVENGVWYRKSLNSGYLKATVVDSDAQDGGQSILLSVNANSPQEKLDNWYTNTLVQFVSLKKKEYTIKFYAKTVKSSDKIFVGIANLKGSSLSGSKWVDITSDWAEYTVTIKVGSDMKDASIVLGLETLYGENGKTLAGSVAIDNVQLY